jgi:sigma-B regulation protein RsbU (phosphoserine phosphatase)
LPYLIFDTINAFRFVVVAHDVKALPWMTRITRIPDALDLSIASALALVGVANLVFKLVRENNPAIRRRLKWVAFGLIGGVIPVFALLVTASLQHRTLDSMPPFILIPCILSPFLIPVTLAYAVLVDRVFDVGVVLRQGLLASKTVAFVRAGLVAVTVYIAFGIAFDDKLPGPRRIGELVGCVVAVAAIRRGAAWLRKWVDRRFFQEAVNTEHLLVELSGQVRAIRDPETLLRTVTERIASAMHVSRVAAAMPGDPLLAQVNGHRKPFLLSDELLVPVAVGGEVFCLLSLGPKLSEEPYSTHDMALLESVAGQTGLALENARLTAAVASEAAQRERITSELEIARTVQERLFPRAAPGVPGLDLAGRCQPAQTVGGDYYDFFTTPSGATGFAIGDIAGKGVPAALLMAGLQASLRGLTLAGISDLADLMGKLNLLMYDASPSNRFATFFCCLYEPATGRLRFSSAGHNPALLWRAGSNRPEWLRTRGPALGLTRKSAYEQAELQLNPGDHLILYTDGVTEARNPAGDEFGEDRLATAMQSAQGSAANILEALIARTNAFASGATQHDDITLIAAVRTN